VVLLVMDATHPFEVQDLQTRRPGRTRGQGLLFVLAKWDLIEDPGQQLKDFREHAERMLPQLRGARWWRCRARPAKGIDKLMPAVLKVHKPTGRPR
jgi:GTP-binding protein